MIVLPYFSSLPEELSIFSFSVHVFEMYVYINVKLCFDASFNDVFEAGA